MDNVFITSGFCKWIATYALIVAECVMFYFSELFILESQTVKKLTEWGLYNTGSGNGLMPDDTKSLPEPKLT